MRAFALLLLLLLAAGAAAAQEGRNLTLKVGAGRVLRLNRDAAQVLVADQAVADLRVVSPRLVYVYGRRIGQTTLHAVDSRDGTLAEIGLEVVRGAAGAQAGLPRDAGGIVFDTAGDRLVARGPVRDLGAAMEVDATARGYAPRGTVPLDRTRLAGTQQITLRVRFAEVSRSDLERYGVNWNVAGQAGTLAFSFLTGGALNAAAAVPGVARGLLGVPGAAQGVVGFGGAAQGLGGAVGSGQAFGGNEIFALGGAGVRTADINAEALLNALARENVVTVLAEPTLTAISGETASFLAGGEVAIPVPQSQFVTTIQYKPFGVGLQFTPTLLPGGRVALRVRPEVSDLTYANAPSIGAFVVPNFTVRRADTTVELGSGQTLAIAGLFQRRLDDTLNRVPAVGDTPVLGALFRSTRFQRNETELVILITPYFAEAGSSPAAFATPSATLPARAPAPPRKERGLAGFVVD